MKAIADAPSKVIITGEHFVVHGAWALAAAIPRRVRVEIRKSPVFQVLSDRFPGHDAPELTPVARVVDELAKEFSVKHKIGVYISSEVPEGSGLGSSASTMVALVSAFSRFHSLGMSPKDVIKYSMIGEREIHGRPSGIDSTICTRGGVLLFKPGSSPRKVTFGGHRTLITAYSGESRSTKGQINKVSEFSRKFPNFFSLLSQSVGELSIMAGRALAEGNMKELGTLLNINHAVLKSLGVSNETLDSLVDASASFGAYGAKLTGAGGGGSIVTVGPEAKEKRIVSGLKARGFETFRARIPADGVRSWLEQ